MTLLFSLLAAVCLVTEEKETQAGNENSMESAISFRIPAGDGDEKIVWWEKDAEHRVIFLPSYVEMEAVRLDLKDGIYAMIGDTVLADGMSFGDLRLDTDYVLKIQDQVPVTIRFVRSANLPAMYLHTVSGNTDTIHSQRNVWEYMELRVVDADGAPDCYERLAEISGRGSGSWYYEKKSYNLKFNQPANLLGMSAGSRWILLANALDESHLRNSTVYRFAREIGSYSGFAPDCAYTDVFLNGAYVGLYLVTEKVEIAQNRVEAGPGTMLFEVDAISRFERMNLPFILDWGIAAGIKSPKSSTEKDRDRLMDYLFEFQETLQDPEDDGESLKYIDIESWTRRYLIDEVFENFDGGCHSQFFFWDPEEGQDNRIFAGPCWDYDNCADSWSEAKQNPRCFLIQRIWKNDSEHTPWYGTLMQKRAFRDRVLELYRTELSPRLHQMLDTGMSEEARFIEPAALLNAYRWDITDPEEAAQQFHDFMQERVAFLDSAWIDGVEYRTITVKSIGDYRFYCTQPGTACADLPSPGELGMEESMFWIREDNGERFDPGTPIQEDIVLTATPEQSKPYSP